MKNLPSENDPLDALLRAPLPPLPRDAFTRRVMAALPPPRPSPISPLWWVLAGAASGVTFAFANGAAFPAFTLNADDLNRAVTAALVSATDPWLTLALITTALSLLLSFVINRLLAPRGF